jgi:hypothetical protein
MALICDLLRQLAPSQPAELDSDFMQTLRSLPREQMRLLAVVCWLLHDPWFISHPELTPAMRKLLASLEVARLGKLVQPQKLVQDPDRREELVRVCLQKLELRPQGETELQAMDRLTALDSAERDRVLRATATAERRARKIREQMAQKAAQDAASRYGE